MKKVFILLMICFSHYETRAQDSLYVKKNQIYLELLGNNFIDLNSNADAGLWSINYCHKIISRKNSFMFSFGMGTLKGSRYDSVRRTAIDVTDINLPAGILWRPHYKRNGLWAGIFFTTLIGKISYSYFNENTYSEIVYTHNSSFQISPNLTYQFQTKSEHFFCRLTLSPKILPRVFFSQKFGDGWKIFPWGGISIGGAW